MQVGRSSRPHCSSSSRTCSTCVRQPIASHRKHCLVPAKPIPARPASTHHQQVHEHAAAVVSAHHQHSTASVASMTTTTTTSGADADASASAVKPPMVPLKCEAVSNIRDLAEAFPAVQPGRVVRCAKPSDASEADVELLLGKLGIRELLDLRSAEEVREDLEGSKLFARATQRKFYGRGWVRPAITLPSEQFRDHEVLHHQVSLLDRARYYVALLAFLPWRVTSWALAMRLLGQQEAFRQTLLKDVNAGGLGLLYKMLAHSAQPEIAAGLRLVKRALEQRRPVLVFCKAGKDRTGIMAMLLLHIAGASRDQILDDYHRSDAYHQVALAGIEKKEELKGLDTSVFERAPKEAMEGLLDYLHQHYGSVDGYLRHIGLTQEEQQQLQQLLTQPALPAAPADTEQQ